MFNSQFNLEFANFSRSKTYFIITSIFINNKSGENAKQDTRFTSEVLILVVKPNYKNLSITATIWLIEARMVTDESDLTFELERSGLTFDCIATNWYVARKEMLTILRTVVTFVHCKACLSFYQQIPEIPHYTEEDIKHYRIHVIWSVQVFSKRLVRVWQDDLHLVDGLEDRSCCWKNQTRWIYDPNQR